MFTAERLHIDVLVGYLVLLLNVMYVDLKMIQGALYTNRYCDV